MLSMRGLGASLVAASMVLILNSGCGGAPKVVDSMGKDASQVDVSTLSPEEKIFRYMGTGEVEPLKALLKSDPSLVNIADPQDGRTPLHIAARNDKKEICQILLDNGANPDARDSDQMSPADLAREAGDLALSKMLQEAAQKKQ